MHPTRQDRPQKLAQWQARLARETISVPRDRGVLWSGVGAGVAKRLAQTMGLVTLEMTPLGASLDSGMLKDELVRDFGDTWIAEKRLVFKMVSTKFAESLTGKVTIFLPETFARPRNGASGSFAFNAKIIWDEFKEADFGDPRVTLHKITSMRLCRVQGERIVSDVFMSASNQLH